MSIVALEAGVLSQSPIIVTNECGINDFPSISPFYIFCDSSETSLYDAMYKAYSLIISGESHSSLNYEQRRNVITNEFNWDFVALQLASHLSLSDPL